MNNILTTEQTKTLGEKLQELADVCKKILNEIVMIVAKFAKALTNCVCKLTLDRREYHLWKYSKSWRVRKKYLKIGFARFRSRLSE